MLQAHFNSIANVTRFSQEKVMMFSSCGIIEPIVTPICAIYICTYTHTYIIIYHIYIYLHIHRCTSLPSSHHKGMESATGSKTRSAKSNLAATITGCACHKKSSRSVAQPGTQGLVGHPKCFRDKLNSQKPRC